MSLKVKFLLNFSLLGANIVLEADNGNPVDNSNIGNLSKRVKDPLVFMGKTVGLNLKLTDILYDLLEKIGLNIEDKIPGDFLPDIELNDIYISYSCKTNQINLIAVTTVNEKEIKLFFQYQPAIESDDPKLIVKKSSAFGIEADFDSLANLPMVGDEMKDVKLNGVGFIFTSVEGKYVLPQLSPASGDEVRKMVFAEKGKEFGKDFNLIGELDLPGIKDALSLKLPLTPKPAPDPDPGTSPESGTKPPASLDPGAKWININKKIGPLAVDKIGLAFADSRLSLLLSGSLTLAGLTISAEGLGVSFKPAKLIHNEDAEPEFKLSGLGLSFVKSPLKISGMFLRVDTPIPVPKPGPNDPYEVISFYGSAQISTSKFSISGVGAYSKLSNGSASFFIYAVYNGPIGGPAFFYVTGIAAGFGYNRTIIVPRLEEVRNFPLVTMAMNPDPKKTLPKILDDLINPKEWIPASPGDYWLAIGIKFTSFKIIESFVLLTVQFGTRLEFAILGLSLLKWPAEGTPIVYIELAVLARFGPGSDVIAVTAMLTPNSYVLDKNCKLSGGFAFYAWVAGEHEGDFVITLGGYHPKYKVPAHYPTVDRLALTWKFNDQLSIHGEMYFALTPKAIMAGGRWEVKYDLSFLSASVIIWADMMIEWAPFHYSIDAGIIIRIEANIKILFIHIHFAIQMGCELHIWGPPFAGEIYVDWTIFSFTIPFGSSNRELPPLLPWSSADVNNPGFIESFVPKKDGGLHPLDTRFIGGVMSEYKDGDGNVTTIINPYELVIGIDSFFPLTRIYTDSTYVMELDPGTLMNISGQDFPVYLKTDGKNNHETNFGIKPMGKGKGDIVIKLTARIEKLNKIIKEKVSYVANTKGMASALWSTGADNNENPVIKNVLSGIELHTTEAKDKNIIDAPVGYVKKNISKSIEHLKNMDAYLPKPSQSVYDQVKNNLNNNKQINIVDSLNSLGFDLPKPGAHLNYDDLNIVTPRYLAAIGQMIPDKIEN